MPDIEPSDEKLFKFLDELRDSGRINMFQAGSYLRDEYGFDRQKSKEIVLRWMKQK
jgi:hypothetical protein